MDEKTAYHAAKLGMWLFLATEILLFGGLFAAYALYHWMWFDEFHRASTELNKWIGGINTVVLLLSSFTAALAVDAAQHGRNDKVVKHLSITILCAVIFLVIKYFEWTGKAAHGLFPTSEFFNSTEFNEKYKAFFGLYYCMTGLHALHVIIGMGLLGWVLMKARNNRFSPDYYTPVEIGALYWHLVDLIWIYLFPLLYLVG
jgi:cytochrome c oxidase subunit 3